MWKNMLEQYGQKGMKPKVLIVDDQPINIRILHEVFTEQFDVLMATSGEKALEQVRTQTPDLILLDIVMPGMDGYEVCRRLKADPLTELIPVIFITSQTEAEVEAYGFEVGAADFISKPINPAVVRARVMTQLTLKLYMDNMRDIAWIDGLTGLANRRRFDEMLPGYWQVCRRERRPIALLMLDVDFFKRYNDSYGHQAGDDCLRQVATAIQQNIRRPMDMCFRYGGEEFACLLPFTDLAGACQRAGAILDTVRQLAIPHRASEISDSITLSIGVDCQIPHREDGWNLLLRNADTALYQGKALGRDRWVSFTS
ncbi:diguanylate cyclase domain-containing protein [Musicola paradisiaca]|uniref:diguanylate cyclase n=1 Tax=Musicola paradisiaca (strain Ech703) TaxID=579405 RepID=C6CCP5_MUSP7|nr:diguanylate cyclase [Musicola paradisiaca]ACS86888.1 response regulator receiver modulated diguanylate cyclase [Musicola paradisiaca Ech703]